MLKLRLSFATLSILFSLIASSIHAEVEVQREPSGVGLPKFQTAPSCSQRPEFLNESRVEVYEGTQALPKKLLVARAAQFYVESEAADGTPIRIYTEQKFVDADSRSPRSRVVCAFANPTLKKSFAMYGMTLLDLRAPQVKTTWWQFQSAVGEDRFGVWNFKTDLLFRGTQSLEAQMKSLGMQTRVYRHSKTRYEILFIKNEEGAKQYLSLVYDVL